MLNDIRSRVGKLRPAKGKSASREHAFTLNGIWPAKEKSAVQDHVNVARQKKILFVF